jgi:hypothetical protein
VVDAREGATAQQPANEIIRILAMSLSNRTIALLAQPFEGGGGPSHSVIELIWESAGAFEYLGEGNKLERVLSGLRSLQSGRRAAAGSPALPADQAKLLEVASDLASRLMAANLVDVDELHKALEQDGFAVFEGEVTTVRPSDEPSDRLAAYVEKLFGTRSEFKVAANHYAQATRAFDRRDWEAAMLSFGAHSMPRMTPWQVQRAAQRERRAGAPASGFRIKNFSAMTKRSSFVLSRSSPDGTAPMQGFPPPQTPSYAAILSPL